MREGFSRHSICAPVRMANQMMMAAHEGTRTTNNSRMHNEISRSTTIIASDKARDCK